MKYVVHKSMPSPNMHAVPGKLIDYTILDEFEELDIGE